MNAFSVLAMMCGFVGFYKLHDGRTGRLGAIAVGTGLLALMAMFAGPVIEYTLDLGGIGWIIFCFGFLPVLPVSLVLKGIATFRARVLAPWCRALPLILGSLLILLFLQGVLVLLVTGRAEQEAWLFTPMLTVGLGWMVMGYAVWSSKNSCAPERPGRVGAGRTSLLDGRKL
jgi:hypothetical protein